MGFSNAELLQVTDWSKVKLNPRLAQPKHPRWVWDHDPEVYAYEHYAKNIETMKKGISFDESGIPPRSIDNIMDAMRKGVPVELGPGNWD
jgi:hypothetical protein